MKPNNDCYDIDQFGEKIRYCCDCSEIGACAENILFCASCRNQISECVYCFESTSSQHLFGCVGLKRDKYCILNKQYSKEEYFILKEKIIAHMKQTGEWGEFFPITMSPFAYNETVAQEYFPLSKGQILKRGYIWREPSETIKASKTIPAERLPNNITDVPDDILNWAIICAESKKPFQIQKPELEFYRKMNLPIPRICPDQRHKRRMQLRNPRKLHQRNCDKCSAEIQTTFAPERPEQVYCEACYLAVVE